MLIVGIDPGKTGALVCITHHGVFHSAIANLTTWQLIDWIKDHRSEYTSSTIQFYIEHAQAMPGQGVSSMFNYGQGFGELLGVVKCSVLSYELIRPAIWTKEMFKGIPKDSKKDKNRNIRVAYELFPEINLLASSRCKKPHLGLVDALLIAEYGRRMLLLNK